MNTKKLVFLGTTLLVLAAVLFFARSAMATDNTCGSGGAVGENGLKVFKTVNCEKSITWSWKIFKEADALELKLALGEPFIVNYKVIASAIAEYNNQVSGQIIVVNKSGATVTIDSISDSLAPVTCPADVVFPYELPSEESLKCTYNMSIKDLPSQNSATLTDASGVEVTAVAEINWDNVLGSEIDKCADISDTFEGALGTVCAGDQTIFNFNYAREFKYDVCGMYKEKNVATFVTNDTGAKGSSTWIVDVDVPCEGGCTLTPGYWKTHSIHGPAPYDSTWDARGGGDALFLGTGVSYYDILWTEPKGGNAFFILAHAFIAAELNGLNDANVPTDVAAAWTQAQELLTKYQITMSITKKSTDRDTAIHLAALLDAYNNGLIGPGHCSE
jgi:hypothetical protein